MNGIPARWQSGWVYSDSTYDNMHDWAQLYLPPYGWVPMDVTFGRLASGDCALVLRTEPPCVSAVRLRSLARNARSAHSEVHGRLVAC